MGLQKQPFFFSPTWFIKTEQLPSMLMEASEVETMDANKFGVSMKDFVHAGDWEVGRNQPLLRCGDTGEGVPRPATPFCSLPSQMTY